MKNNTSYILFTLLVIAGLVLLNFISFNKFVRLDLTRDGKFTLSQASVETMERLEDTMTVSAYFTKNLPSPYAQHSRYVQDLLDEYLAKSGGRFGYEFIDPMESLSKEDQEKRKTMKRNIFGGLVIEPTSIEKELAEFGLQRVQFRVIERDQQQTRGGYLGLIIRYQGKHEVIPVVQNLNDIEKEMTSLMRKLVRERTPKLGIIAAVDGPKLAKFREAASKNVEITNIDLVSNSKIDDDIDALLIAGSGEHFGDNGAKKIDDFLRSGKSAAILLDRYNVDPRSFMTRPVGPESKTHEIFDLLSTYGIEVSSSLVADASCASLNIQENRGGFSFSLPVKYPFVPELKNMSYDSPISKGLSGVILPFVTRISVAKKPGLETVVLAESSKVSWLEKEPLDTNPRRNWGEAQISPDGPHKLLVQALGVLPGENNNSEQDVSKKLESRLVVMGSSAFMWDDFLSGPNQVLALNIVDWMLSDRALLEMRARTFTDAPLDADMSDGAREGVKYGNIFGVPLLLIIYGIIRWRLRESRRNKLKTK